MDVGVSRKCQGQGLMEESFEWSRERRHGNTLKFALPGVHSLRPALFQKGKTGQDPIQYAQPSEIRCLRSPKETVIVDISLKERCRRQRQRRHLH